MTFRSGRDTFLQIRSLVAVYNIFRWYRAGWGRYTQADPAGRSSTDHIYTYATANPLQFSDPLGLYSIAANCNDGKCGPPSIKDCWDKPTGLCFGPVVNDMKQKAFGNQKCRQTIAANGVDWGFFVRSMMPSDPLPLVSCDQSLCAPGSFGDYYGALKLVAFCGNSFITFEGAASTMFHEFLHHAGVPDGGMVMKSIMGACYPNYWSGVP